MRSILATLLALACTAMFGCSLLNPTPTTEGSRISEKLGNLPSPDPAKRRTVTVYRFENKTGFPHGLAISHGMSDQLTTALVKSHHFKPTVFQDLLGV